MRATRARVPAVPAMVRERLHDAVGDREGIPSCSAWHLDVLSGANCGCQVRMLVADGIALRDIDLPAGENP